MNTIRAVSVLAEGEAVFGLASAPLPEPTANEAIVEPKAVSLNRGEVRHALTARPAGWRPGWDLAGVVIQAAADGSGPPLGARVVGFMEAGAWAERVAVSTRALAEIPASVSYQQAATFPVAGLTALEALDRTGSLVGKRVLINGASGGVGHFACQIARASGAYVVAAVAREAARATALENGAHHVIVDSSLASAQEFGPFDLVLESVGGDALANALTLLTRDGVCVVYGNSSAQPAPIDISAFYVKGRARIEGLFLVSELREKPASRGLTRLIQLVASGLVKPRIAAEERWKDVDEVAKRFYLRGIQGKVVLTID